MAHIQERRLFDAAQGRITLEGSERDHLHKCEECLQLFKVFARQSFYPPDPDNPDGGESAA